jgi:hypothetical protein
MEELTISLVSESLLKCHLGQVEGGHRLGQPWFAMEKLNKKGG